MVKKYEEMVAKVERLILDGKVKQAHIERMKNAVTKAEKHLKKGKGN